jgi:predicted transcriptional regulator
MTTISLRLPDSLHNQLRELAQRDNISINQLITLAVAEKISALNTAEYFEERAARATREKFEHVLSKIPDVPPDEKDRL